MLTLHLGLMRNIRGTQIPQFRNVTAPEGKYGGVKIRRMWKKCTGFTIGQVYKTDSNNCSPFSTGQNSAKSSREEDKENKLEVQD